MKIGTLITIVVAAIMLAYPNVGRGRQAPERTSPVLIQKCNDASIRTFLSGMAQGAGNYPGSMQYVCRKVGEGSSTEVLIYFDGRDACGSGGCTLQVFVPNSDLGYILVGDVRTVWAPIRVLKSKTNGLYDLVGFVAGGGILRGYNAKLTYDGKSYPPGGSYGTAIPPGAPLGTVVISKAMAAHPPVM